MSKAQKPMLAGKLEFNEVGELPYPIIGAPKYDGIRVLMSQRKPRTRTGKEIPNICLSQILASTGLNNVDGEIFSPSLAFSQISRIFRTEQLTKFELGYFLFDWFGEPETGFKWRRKTLEKVVNRRITKGQATLWIYVSPIKILHNEKELWEYFDRQVADGHEGIMLRSPFGIYKEGRSTVNERYLLKLKPEEKGIATIVDVEQLEDKNGNYREELGALLVGGDEWESHFGIGTGFTREQRQLLWTHRKDLIGKRVNFTYSLSGTEEVPRFSVFKGFVVNE